MARSRIWLLALGLVVAAGLAALLVMSTSSRRASSPPQSVPAGSSTAPETPVAALPTPDSPVPAAAPRKRATRRPGARTSIPRAPRPQITERDRPAVRDGDRARPELSPVGDLTDRRNHPKTDAKQLMTRLRGGLEQMRDDVEQCLAAWSEFDPTIAGEVMLGFTIDPSGLDEVWIEDYVDVPVASLTCFSAAVYEVDWADLTEEPIQITHGFTYRSGDSEHR